MILIGEGRPDFPETSPSLIAQVGDLWAWSGMDYERDGWSRDTAFLHYKCY
jgi:hypothetical protein